MSDVKRELIELYDQPELWDTAEKFADAILKRFELKERKDDDARKNTQRKHEASDE